MTTLITGGTGFIGAEITRLLHQQDEGPLHVAHRSGNFGRLGRLADDVSLVHIDLADVDAVAAMVQSIRPTRIFHFGAMLTGPGEQDPQALLQANAHGVMALFESARLAGTEQLIFASSIGTYGRDLEPGRPVDDRSPQRPDSIYGVTKVFAENLGAYYRSRYGLDFRGLRYPSIVGPGVTTRSLAQYTSWMIEAAAKGEPFTVWTGPDAVIPILYYKDAAQAALDLGAAPIEGIRSINYLVDGPRPTPNAGELADAVRAQIPDATIVFEPDSRGSRRDLLIDDSCARDEWGWAPRYELDEMISDVITEVRAGSGH